MAIAAYIIHNVSGRKESSAKRQAPVIGGVRLRPGTSMAYTESQWNSLNPNTKKNIHLLIMTDVLALQRNGVSAVPNKKSKAKNLSAKEPIIEKPDGEELAIKKLESEEPVVEKTITDEETLTITKTDEGSKNDDLDIEEPTIEKVVPDEDEEVLMTVEDYENVLSNSIKIIQSKMSEVSKMVGFSIEDMIAVEKAGENRRTLLEYLGDFNK